MLFSTIYPTTIPQWVSTKYPTVSRLFLTRFLYRRLFSSGLQNNTKVDAIAMWLGYYFFFEMNSGVKSSILFFLFYFVIQLVNGEYLISNETSVSDNKTIISTLFLGCTDIDRIINSLPYIDSSDTKCIKGQDCSSVQCTGKTQVTFAIFYMLV